MTHPRLAPRAPIVWQDTRDEITPRTLAEVGPLIASTKERARFSRDADAPEPHLPGQLWRRIAELEVATYGEPRPLDVETHEAREARVVWAAPGILRATLDAEIEARREPRA